MEHCWMRSGAVALRCCRPTALLWNLDGDHAVQIHSAYTTANCEHIEERLAFDATSAKPLQQLKCLRSPSRTSR